MRKTVFSILALSVLMLNSCDFRKYGCTDHDALNYNEKANRNDHSCIFETSGVFWWDSSTQFNFNFSNVTSMTVELNDEVIASNIETIPLDSCITGLDAIDF